MRTHELTHCPSCGEDESTELALEGARGTHSLRRCAGCGLIYAEEYADPEEIYVDGYLTGETGDFGLDLSHPLFQEAMDHFAHKRLGVVEGHTGGPATLLDVGCGSGELLRNALDRGWRAVGVEPVAASAATAQEQGLEVHATTLEESGLEEGSFDVVTAYHVLEHMPAGTDFLRLISRWARPGGLVVVEVPNFESVHRRNTGSGWAGLRPLEHVAHYSPATLERAFARAGLEPVEVRTLGFLWHRQGLVHMLEDLGHRRWERVLAPLCRRGEVGGAPMRVPTPPVRALLSAVQWAYDRRRVGQVVTGVARVPDSV